MQKSVIEKNKINVLCCVPLRDGADGRSRLQSGSLAFVVESHPVIWRPSPLLLLVSKYIHLPVE